jgi:PAS domain S-box-containing protein
MVSAAVAQLGLSVEAPFILGTEDKLCNVFHVEEALGSAFVPDQADFVRPYGIKSVLGFGGLLADEEMFVVILFCAAAVGRGTADLFRLVAPSVGLSLVATRRDPGAVEHRLRTTQELLRHHERIALAHVRQEREAGERLARSEYEARGNTVELREALRRVEAHHAVTRALAESDSMRDAIPRILGALGEALGCDLAYAWQPDPTGQKLEHVGAWPVPTPIQFADFAQLTRATVFGSGVGLPGRVWMEGKPAWLVDVTDDPNFPRAHAAAGVGLHTGFAFPAVLNDEVVFVFEIFAKETRARDEDVLSVLAHIGNQIGQFIARARANDAMKLSDARKGAIVQAALDCIVSMNAAGCITEFNPAAERIFGYRKDDVLGKDMASLLIPPLLRATHRRGLARYLAGSASRLMGKHVEFSALRADGTEFPIELTITRIDVSEGPMFTAFIRDTTDRQQAAKERERADDALRASEYRFRTLTRQAPVGIIAMDTEGRCNFVNERWCQMAGMNPEQAMDHGWHDAIDPTDRQSVLALFYEAATTASDFAAQFRLRTRQGAETWVQGAALPLRSSNGELTGYLGTVTDISERMQDERVARFLADATSTLSASLDYDAALQAVARLAVPTLADCCTVHVVEDGAIRLVAVAHGNGKTAALIHDVARSYEMVSTAPEHLRRIRALHPELVSEVAEDLLPKVVLSPAHAAVWRTMIVRSYLAAPLIARGRVVGAIHLMRGESGRGFSQADLACVEDLARRAAFAIENARLYREAQEAIRAREEFLTIASHELRTPLTTLQLAVQRLEAPLKSAEPGRVFWLERIQRSTRRLTSLAEDLLEVTRGRGARLRLIDLEEVDLSQITRSVIGEMREEIARSGSKVLVRASRGMTGHWDRRRIEQVLLNLLSNAIKFGSKKPIAIVVDGNDTSIRLRIRDHGIGIPPHECSRIFQRFGRAVSDRHYGGLGLGLWTVRQVVEAHGGTVAVKSEPGKGATFTVELPRSGPHLAAGPAEQVGATDHERHEGEHH